MGLVNAKIILKNPRERNLQALEVNALADSGSVHLCLGAISMEDMDLVIIPRNRILDVNPESPNIACSIAK